MQEAKCSDAQDRHTIEATILSWFETSDLEVGSNVQFFFSRFFFSFNSSGLIVVRYSWGIAINYDCIGNHHIVIFNISNG